MVLFIYNAVHRDTRAEEEYEKVDKYQNLAWLLKRLWKVNNNTMQIAISALGTTPKSLEKNLQRAGTTVSINLLKKAALLGTSRILKVLDTGQCNKEGEY